MKSINFWQKWLLVVTILIILFGLLLLVPNKSILFDRLFNDRMAAIFWPETAVSPGVIQFQKWIFGVLGATMVGWGIMMAFIISVPFRKGELWAWNCIAIGIFCWYILDTVVSTYYQAIFNSILNTIILFLFLPPLMATYKHFRHGFIKSSPK